VVARILGWPIVLIAAVAACMRAPLRDTGESAVDAAVAGEVGPAPDAGADAPGAPDADETPVCRADSDCVLSGLRRPVASVDDCYCPDPCPTKAVNQSAAASRAREWDEFCGALPAFNDDCPLAGVCAPASGPYCIGGRCGP
jgi:hypothetical protein